MMAREVSVAGLLGLTMAGAVLILGPVRGGPEVALIVAMTMVGFDPATVSAPLITTTVDAAGVLIYFAIASALLIG
jgi:magnesium transporter